MQSLEAWFLTRLSWPAFLCRLPIIIAIDIALTLVGLAIVYPSLTDDITQRGLLKELSLMDIVAIAPLIEEGVFRWLPFVIALGYVMYRERNEHTHLPLKTALNVALWSSLLFGYLHGGAANILIQGVGGFLYALVYLKMSQLGRYPARGYVASTLTHSTFNGCLMGFIAFVSL